MHVSTNRAPIKYLAKLSRLAGKIPESTYMYLFDLWAENFRLPEA